MSRAQNVLGNLLALADIQVGGARPWDIQVQDTRFFGRVLASGPLGFGESYMDGWWDCDDLAEFFNRATGAKIKEQFRVTPNLIWQHLKARRRTD